MNLMHNKKGDIWPYLVAFIIGLAVLVALIIIAAKYGGMGFDQITRIGRLLG